MKKIKLTMFMLVASLFITGCDSTKGFQMPNSDFIQMPEKMVTIRIDSVDR